MAPAPEPGLIDAVFHTGVRIHGVGEEVDGVFSLADKVAEALPDGLGAASDADVKVVFLMTRRTAAECFVMIGDCDFPVDRILMTRLTVV